MTESFRLLGVDIQATPFDAAVERVHRAPDVGERLAIHFATAHSLVEANDSPQLREAFSTGLVHPDGMPLVWMGRRMGHVVERVCGPDFMPALMARGVDAGRRHFLFGGAPGVPERIAERLRALHPDIRIVGTMSPPFRPLNAEEDAAIVDEINAAEPDYVWVGLGAPKQDLWVADHRERLSAAALLAVGAAFDFHAGTRRRAPRWMQRTGTEWLHRLGSEPRRLAGRYTRVNARFVRLVVQERRRPRSARSRRR